MRVHIVQHADCEPPGAILDWAVKNKHDIRLVQPAKGDRLPVPADTDFLVILGGPFSVHDEESQDWLSAEKAAIKTFINLDQKPLLGICFGAQLIADSLGAMVFQNEQPEIGWYRTNFQRTGVFKTISDVTMMLFHWHGEVFNLPKGAVLLADSKITPVQGFQYGKFTLGLQFHPEVNSTSLKALLAEFGDSINSAHRTRQNSTEIRKLAKEHMKRSALFLEEMLGHFLSK
jgi:GMP synthase-like glutamine amidotransferase